ncbi:MAG TPA: hypothetical protein VHO84_14330 [Syntrophorhabdaceae bacterium]|nr:hypothetical protein [Syntrophorhabdaceae bacterium]
MGLPTNLPPTTSTELEHLGKKRALGEANLGSPGVEVTNGIATIISNGPTAISGKTARSSGS